MRWRRRSRPAGPCSGPGAPARRSSYSCGWGWGAACGGWYGGYGAWHRPFGYAGYGRPFGPGWRRGYWGPYPYSDFPYYQREVALLIRDKR